MINNGYLIFHAVAEDIRNEGAIVAGRVAHKRLPGSPVAEDMRYEGSIVAGGVAHKWLPDFPVAEEMRY